jgi:hypothetical protein
MASENNTNKVRNRNTNRRNGTKNNAVANNTNNALIRPEDIKLGDKHTVKFKGFQFHINNKSDTDYEIYIGSPDDHCAHIKIYKPTTSRKSEIDYITAVLELFVYDRTCNITKNLMHGNGTKRMMSAIKHFIKAYFSHIKHIELADHSIVECTGVSRKYTKIANKLYTIGILMYVLSICKHGTGYYEQHHGFKISPTGHEQHMTNIKAVNTIKLDSSLYDKLETYKLTVDTYERTDLSKLFTEIDRQTKTEPDLTLAQFIRNIGNIPERLCIPVQCLFDFFHNSKLGLGFKQLNKINPLKNEWIYTYPT